MQAPTIPTSPSTAVATVLEDALHRLEEQRRLEELKHFTRFSRFQGLVLPRISIKDYMDRMLKYMDCSESCYYIALIYIDRVVQRHRLFLLSPFNVHR